MNALELPTNKKHQMTEYIIKITRKPYVNLEMLLTNTAFVAITRLN